MASFSFLDFTTHDVFDVVLHQFTLAELARLRRVCKQLCARCDAFRFHVYHLQLDVKTLRVGALERFLALRTLQLKIRENMPLDFITLPKHLEGLSICRADCRDGLECLQKYRNLTSLSLVACPSSPSVSGLERLVNLTDLELVGFPLPHPTKQLAALRNLRSLALVNPTNQNIDETMPKDLTAFQGLVCSLLPEQLQALTIQAFRISSANFLARLGQLREVVLCELEIEVIESFSPTWEKLTISNCGRLRDLNALGICTSLKELTVSRCDILRSICPTGPPTTLPNLTHLTLNLNTRLQALGWIAPQNGNNDPDMEGWPGGLILPALVSLKVTHSPLLCVDGNKTTELNIFDACTETLEELVLERCKVTDPDLALKLPNLRALSIVGVQFPYRHLKAEGANQEPPTEVAASSQPSSLRTLTIELSLRHIVQQYLATRGLGLVELNILTRDPLPMIAQFCPNLTSLSVADCNTIADLKPIAKLVHLVHLNINGVHSVGSLAPLEALHKLTSLELNSSLHLHLRTKAELKPLVDISDDPLLIQRLVNVRRLGVPNVSTFEHGQVAQRWYATELWLARDKYLCARTAQSGKRRPFWRRDDGGDVGGASSSANVSDDRRRSKVVEWFANIL